MLKALFPIPFRSAIISLGQRIFLNDLPQGSSLRIVTLGYPH